MVELHCPVVCINKPKGKVLIVRRSEDREVLPGLWEFGAAKPNMDEPLRDVLEREYKEDFCLDIALITSAVGDNPVPIASYEVEKESGLCKGIVFMALVKNPGDINITSKHSEYRWIGVEDLNDLDDDECVPDLKYNALAALSLTGCLRKTK